MPAPDQQPDGSINIRLSAHGRVGVRVSNSTPKSPPWLEMMDRIIAIDGVAIKGVPLDKVHAMLRGPVGSKVTFEILSFQGHMRTLILTRQPVVAAWPKAHPETIMRQASDFLDGCDEDDLPSNSSAIGACSRAAIEPYASALQNEALALSRRWFDDRSITAIAAAAQAAPYYDRIGRIDQADEAIDAALEAIDLLDKTGFWDLRFLVAFALHLQKTGRHSKAEAVYKKIVALSQTGMTDRRLEALRPYAKFLADHGRIPEARSAYDQLMQLNQLNQRSNASQDLLLAADFYGANGQPEKAIAIYGDFVVAAEAGWSETQRNYDRDRPIVEVLYKKASLQADAGFSDAAIATLVQAQSVYNRRLHQDKLIETERIPMFFPTISDLDIKLAEINYDKSDFVASADHLQRAITRIEKALGPSSAFLHRPLMQLAVTYAAMDDELGSEQTRRRADSIEPPASDESAASDQEDEAMIYDKTVQIYLSIQSQNYDTAVGAIDFLFTLYLTKSRDDSAENEFKKNDLWSCLTYWPQLLIDRQQFRHAGQLLQRLLEAAQLSGEHPSKLLSVLTERAIFAKRLQLSPQNCWGELETALAFQVPPDREDATTRGTTGMPDFPPSEKLRRWSLAYSHSGDYVRAAAILARARMAPSASLPPGRHSTAVLTPLLLADIALVDLNLGQFRRAKTSIDAVLQGDRNIGAQTGRKLVQLADTYERLGQTAEARDLLERAIVKGVYPAATAGRDHSVVPGFYQWKLAGLLFRHEQHQQAEQIAAAAFKQYERTGPPISLSMLCAEIALALGQYDRAARFFLQTGRRIGNSPIANMIFQDIKETVLKKAMHAIHLAQQSPDDRDERLTVDETVCVIKALAQSLQNADRQAAIVLYQRALDLLPADNKQSAEIAATISHMYAGQKDKTTERLQALLLAAQAAERVIPSSACHSWLTMAQEELATNRTDLAIVHIEHALSLFQKFALRRTGFSPPLPHSNNSIVRTLCLLGRGHDAGRLLKLAVDATTSRFGDGSVEQAIALAELVDFCATIGEKEHLTAGVDRILRIYADHEAQPPLFTNSHWHAAIRRLQETCERLSQAGDRATALDITTRILEIQRQKLPANNIQTAHTLIALGTLHKNAGEFALAEPVLGEALAIMKVHWGRHRAIGHCLGLYADVLRALGRADDADRLTTLAPEPSEPGDEVTFGQLGRQVHECERLKQIDRAQQLLQQAYAAARVEMPYGSAALRSLKNLAEFHLRHLHFEQSEQTYKQLLDMFADGALGFPGQKKECLLALARIYLTTNRIDQAIASITAAKKADLAILSGELTLFCACQYAELEIDAGLNTEAFDHIEMAQQLIDVDPDDTKKKRAHLPLIAKLWEKLGDHRRAAEAKAKADALADQPRIAAAPPPVPKTAAAPEPVDSKMTADANKKIDFGPYMADVERRVRRAWFPAEEFRHEPVQVIFVINKSGTLLDDPPLLCLSNSEEAKLAALAAIRSATPFRPLPPGANDVERFEYTFNFRQSPDDGAIRRLEP